MSRGDDIQTKSSSGMNYEKLVKTATPHLFSLLSYFFYIFFSYSFSALTPKRNNMIYVYLCSI